MDLIQEFLKRFQYEVSFSSLDETRIRKILDYEIYVYTNEGPIPHFHMKNTQTNKDCCIKICSCEYFNHKKDHQFFDTVLNVKEKKDLVEFLNKKLKKYPISYYNFICMTWESNNPSFELPDNLIMPNYMKL